MNKVLYGLRKGPKKWSDHRDVQMEGKTINASDKDGNISFAEATCEQCRPCKNSWKIIDNGVVIGGFIVYVDDIMIFAPPEWVMGTIRMVQSLWQCKISGTLMPSSKDHSDDQPCINESTADFTALLKRQLHFLGVTLEINDDGVLTLHQHNYILSKLEKRELLTGKSRPSLPAICESHLLWKRTRNTWYP